MALPMANPGARLVGWKEAPALGMGPASRLAPPRRAAVAPHRTGRGKFPVAAIILDDYLPMQSTEVKNRTSTGDITSLRLITAVKTPYLPDGRFDLEAYDSLINMQIEGGAEGVIVGGTTGEGHLMSWDEHIMLIGRTVNCFGSRIKVIGNTGSNSTREAVHATEQGFAVGMHAALHINPYYGKTSTEGLISHFEAVLPMGPTIIYNVPSRSGHDITPEIIEAISGYSNLVGVKECVGHERVKCYTDKGITIWSGNDDECHDSRWKYGATGVISVASNLVPGLMRSLMYEGVLVKTAGAGDASCCYRSREMMPLFPTAGLQPSRATDAHPVMQVRVVEEIGVELRTACDAAAGGSRPARGFLLSGCLRSQISLLSALFLHDTKHHRSLSVLPLPYPVK
ncbi:4-hydroxy-tetrahydrodipicolinate synthase 2, chloroplastic-like [Panicum miliaceum]|uniref:4-hydroxy-tetrahydrodipicolinate synthase n=1 Tax=Panicum miliaceum TaxID=4540 RepID=A0A3L6PUE1_PANMI|nr:4-hydroxy-tetrahydrodipicolinate synthase 2, chloroplastic-like [Panicum miliaceum]